MSRYIYSEAEKLIRRFHTRDPFSLLEALHVNVFETDRYQHLKGYCFMSCRSLYVAVSSFLSEEEKQVVAAHELGHIVLHRRLLKLAPMSDTNLYLMNEKNEYEANLFAADLLIADDEMERILKEQDPDYFQLCRALSVSPELMSFKLYSLIRRGHSYRMPIPADGTFLKKDSRTGEEMQ